jgi:hypothetical protein
MGFLSDDSSDGDRRRWFIRAVYPHTIAETSRS